MSKTAYDRYAPFIQEYIYRKGWEDLRQVQVDACEAILDSDDHVIIASGTASGKTEAAFFPILTRLEEDTPQSVGVLYISPLKALINDQFQRLEELLTARQYPVWAWHGDVSQSAKNRALAQARGILQITPESLEAMLMGKGKAAKRLFCDLRFVVIDEIHAFMGADRGLQLQCLLQRLERSAGCNPRRIGLSATLHDYAPAMAFLGAGSGRGVRAVGTGTGNRRVALCAQTFTVQEKASERLPEPCVELMYQVSHQKKCLIFTNSRGDAEEVVTALRRAAEKRHEPDIFHVHHGSVSAALRKEAEQALKEDSAPAVAAATLTLELGIDIGRLDSVIQLGSPYSCSSFVQRLGRSGRRSGVSRMMFLSLCPEEKEQTDPIELIPWVFLRSIAIIQLYLEEKWVEPFTPKPRPYSLLVHQTLSTLMAMGELSPAELARQVLTLPPFREKVTAEAYRVLLRHMLEKEYLHRLEGGGIIVGLEGEKLTNHYGFYAVFPDEETYRVLWGGSEVGTLTICPTAGGKFRLAGQVWQVEGVDKARKTIYVQPASGDSGSGWLGGKGAVHSRIAQKIRQILGEERQYDYLLPEAKETLNRARALARKKGLLSAQVIPAAGGLYLCPWRGTVILDTIKRLMTHGLRQRLKIRSVADGEQYLFVGTELSQTAFLQALREVHDIPLDDPAMVLHPEEVPREDKYDELIPDELIRESFLHNQMDMPGAVEVLVRMGWGMEDDLDTF